MARILLGVQGMDNQAAADRAERALTGVAGVRSVQTGLDGQALVDYDEAELTVMDLIRALRRAGFLAGVE